MQVANIEQTIEKAAEGMTVPQVEQAASNAVTDFTTLEADGQKLCPKCSPLTIKIGAGVATAVLVFVGVFVGVWCSVPVPSSIPAALVELLNATSSGSL